MVLIYAVSIILLLLLILFFFRLIQLRKKNFSVRLFNIALKSENDSNFELAISQYETALAEIKRTGKNIKLRTKIIEKIKLLKIVLQYQKG